LQLLAREDHQKAELVKLRFYAGLSAEETAQVMGVSEKTIQRHWIHARAWLFRELQRLVSSR
jgi:DNA-directed RNA polymerase specialized sigma24 family protein